MSLNSGSASGILQGSRYNRGAGTAGTGATHASTVDTGSVLSIETNKTNGIILYCQPETTVPSVNADVQVTLLTAQSTNRGGAFIAPRVGDKIVWLTSKGNSFYLGMSHQATSPQPFLGDTDVDATTGGTNTGGASMLMTGMRIPDQPLGTTSDDPLPIENAQVDGAPGTGFANVPGSDVLMDPKTNTFRSVGEITGNASPNEPYDIPDSVFGKSSSDFKTVMQALNKAKDPAYAKAKGYGFNEISVRSRAATFQGGSGSNAESSTATSGTSTNGGSVIPPGAKLSPDGFYTTTKTGELPQTNPEKYAPGTTATSTNNSYKPTSPPGGVMVYGQDYVDLWSTKTLTSMSLTESTLYAGTTLRIEAGDEIILQVGRSSITINQDGIAIAQSELGGIGSSLRMSNDSIETYSVTHEIDAWNFAVNVPWATLNLAPMNAVLAACQGVEVKSGFKNYAPFCENLAEYAIQMMILGADMTDVSGTQAQKDEQKKDLELDMADATVLAMAGVPLNFPVMVTNADSPLSVPPGFAALDIMGPAMGMLNGIMGEVIAGAAGKGGSATVRLNNADVTIQAGYVEQIPNEVKAAIVAQDVEAAAAAGATAATGSTNVALGAAIAAGVAGAVGQAVASKFNVEKPLLVSGLGNVRIEASQSMTSGAYQSNLQAATAAPAQTLASGVAQLLSGAFPLSVASVLNLMATVTYAKQLTKKGFVGVTGVGSANAFTYHNLGFQHSAPTGEHTTVPLDPAMTDTMTEILLEGPSGSSQHELDESAEGDPQTGEDNHGNPTVTRTLGDGSEEKKTFETNGNEVTTTTVTTNKDNDDKTTVVDKMTYLPDGSTSTARTTTQPNGGETNETVTTKTNRDGSTETTTENNGGHTTETETTKTNPDGSAETTTTKTDPVTGNTESSTTKKTNPDGSIETSTTTKTNPDRSTETTMIKNNPDGSSETTTTKTDPVTGNTETTTTKTKTDGTIEKTNPDRSTEIITKKTNPDGTIETTTVKTNPDGTVEKNVEETVNVNLRPLFDDLDD